MEIDEGVVSELRAMARDGRAPHEIAQALWTGAAKTGNIAWMAYMRQAFGVPLQDLKALGAGYEPADLDRELAPWVNTSVAKP